MNDYKELIEQLDGACYFKMADGDISKADLFARAADAIEQLVKERDAALEDVLVHCGTCRHSRTNKPNGESCDRVYQCYGDTEDEYLKWEWRGVMEDNNG